MSIFFLTIALAMAMTDASFINEELMYFWALFAIADALWVKILFGGKK